MAHDRRHHGEAGVEYGVVDDAKPGSSFFSEGETSQIYQGVAVVKELLRTQLQLESGQLAEVEVRLDELADKSNRLTRRDWKAILYGTVVSLVADQIVSPDVAHTIFGLLVRELPQLITTPLPMLTG